MERINLPGNVKYILDKLHSNNFEAYVVGGCVRDAIIGKEPNDWDICTSALPEEIINIFKDNTIIPTGLKHGTVTIVLDGIPYEITTYRIDGEYKDNRHPENVSFTNKLCEDLKRRDFTINAIAYNEEGIVDIFDGVRDINTRTIRCVGNPADRFKEDALRMMRAIRFASTYSFEIHYRTLFSILCNKQLLKNISIERINSELTKTLKGKCTNKVNVYMLLTCLKEIVPELKLFYLQHLVETFIKTPVNIYVRLSTIFNFENSDTVLKVLKRLKYDNDTIKKVIQVHKYGNHINREYLQFKNKQQFAKLLVKEIGNKMAFLSVDFAMSLQKYENSELLKLKDYINEIIDADLCCSLKQMKINGNDLKALGYEGEQIGDCLEMLLFGIISDELINEKECLLNKASAWITKKNLQGEGNNGVCV